MALFLDDYSPSDAFKIDGGGSREKFAVHLMGLLESFQEGKVIFVDGEWGSGKTTFKGQFADLLKSEGWSFAKHDAFENDYAEEPFLPLMADFMKLYRKKFENDSRIEEFAEKSKKVLKKLAVVGGRVAMRAATLNAVGKEEAEDVGLILKGAMNDAGSFGGDLVDDMLSGKSESEFKHFRDQMEEAALAIAEKNKVREEGEEDSISKPVLILVDELDRCRPDYAIQLLERVKHLFDVPGLSFVFFLNFDSLAKGIERVYGEIDGRLYLQKFSDFTTKLPKLGITDVRISSRISRYPNLTYEVQNLEQMASNWGLTLRSLERAADRICIAFHFFQRNRGGHGVHGGHGVELALMAFLIETIPNEMSRWAAGGKLDVSSVEFFWLEDDYQKKNSSIHELLALRFSLASYYSSNLEHAESFYPAGNERYADLSVAHGLSDGGNLNLVSTRKVYEAMTVLTSPEHS